MLGGVRRQVKEPTKSDKIRVPNQPTNSASCWLRGSGKVPRSRPRAPSRATRNLALRIANLRVYHFSPVCNLTRQRANGIAGLPAKRDHPPALPAFLSPVQGWSEYGSADGKKGSLPVGHSVLNLSDNVPLS